MDESIKWDTLIDKDKVKLILEHVILHDMGDDLVLKDNDITTPRGSGARAVNWPIAAWDNAIECWRTRGRGSNFLTPFDPVHNMNAAWQIVEKLGEKLFDIRLYREEGLLKKYCVNIWIRDGGRIAGSGDSNISMADAICKAALRAKGVKIDDR